MRCPTLLLILFIAGLGMGAGVPLFDQAGPRGDGTGVTPNHWMLTPAGIQVEVGDRPMGMALSPDSRYLFISNNGQGVQSLVLFDTYTNKTVQVVPYYSPEALFFGVAVSADGTRIYASAGGNNKIRVYSFDGKIIKELEPFRLGDAKAALYPAGLALSPDGSILYAAMNLDNSIAVIDTVTGLVRASIRLGAPGRESEIGKLPYALALLSGGKKLYVSEWNGGGVSVIDTQENKLHTHVPTGDHASGLAVSPDGSQLYVANANTDTVTVVDTSSDTVMGTVDVSPYPRAPMGSMPNAVAVSPDGRSLYVANGGNNDVAVVDTATRRIRGLIPTAWFPSALAVSHDGRVLYVADMKGVGAGPNRRGPNPERPSLDEQYVANLARGTVSVIEVPTISQLARYTAQVVKNNGFDEIQKVLTRTARDTIPHAIPRRPGDPTPITHVIYIIKENRTYDQVLGDLRQGNGDPTLVLFGRGTSPNHHALAETFTLFDNCYVDAEVSPDGHNWSMAAIATDYLQKLWPATYSNRNRSYDYEGGSKAPAPSGGYLWEYAARAQISYQVYGEFNDFFSRPPNVKPAPATAALEGHLSPTYAGYNLSLTDQDRFQAWKAEFDTFVQRGVLPALMIMRLPNDHTAATQPGFPRPKAMMADNDLALGKVVETVSNSPFWKDTAIFVIEDDAQNGPDHVDAHRTVCLVASPFARRGLVDHTFYSTVSMLRTIELILGLPPMSQFDAAAIPMFAAFTDTPNATKYQALIPQQSLAELNSTDAYRAEDSKRLALDRADEADEATFNEILWYSIKGPNVPIPPVQHAIFRSRIGKQER